MNDPDDSPSQSNGQVSDRRRRRSLKSAPFMIFSRVNDAGPINDLHSQSKD